MDPLAAFRGGPCLCPAQSAGVGGSRLTSAPESTKNRLLLWCSSRYRVGVGLSAITLASDDRVPSFPGRNYKVRGTYELCFHT